MAPIIEVRSLPGGLVPTAEIAADGSTVLRIRGPGAWEKANRLAARLRRALLEGRPPKAIRAIKVPGGFQIVLDGQPVLTADRESARAAQMSIDRLASLWTSALRSLLSLTSLSAPAAQWQIAVGETVRIPLGGTASGVIYHNVDPPNIAIVEADGTGVSVTGTRPGRGYVTVRRSGVSLRMTIWVAFRSARLSNQPVAWIRGPSLSRWLIGEAVENALWHSLETPFGARWSYQITDRTDRASDSVVVRVQASGPNLLPFDRRIPVAYRTSFQGPGDAGALIVSNDPETITQPGVLVAGRLRRGVTVRLLSHHRNGTQRLLSHTLQIINASDQPARISLRGGIGGPSDSELTAGHVAVRDYLECLRTDSAVSLLIPPQTVYGLFPFGLLQRDTISMILDIRNDDGSDLFYRLTVAPSAPSATKVSPLDGSRLSQILDSDDGSVRFETAVKDISATHRAGERWTHISIGREPVRQGAGDRVLKGNYGVLYRVRITFVNDTPRPYVATVECESAGGVVRGAVVVDGRLIQLPTVHSHQKFPLLSFELKPGDSRSCNLVTTPAPGSFYPIHIIARTDKM